MKKKDLWTNVLIKKRTKKELDKIKKHIKKTEINNVSWGVVFEKLALLYWEQQEEK